MNCFKQRKNQSASFLSNNIPSPRAAQHGLEFQTSFWYLPWTKLVSKRKPFGSALSNRVYSPLGTVLERQ
jgi:hypothetical protein